jgi:hypothetical protein
MDRFRDNPLTRLYGWLLVGRWIPSRAAFAIFREAFALRTARFRAACIAGTIALSVAALVTALGAMEYVPSLKFERAAKIGIAGVVVVGVLYHAIMRSALRRELNMVWRRRGENICIGCGYSRIGLDAVAICPECGRAAP